MNAPTRRLALGQIACVGAVAAAAAPVGATDGADPHVAWEREAASLRAAFERAEARGEPFAEDDPDCPLARCWAIEDRIAETPARTPAGILTQVRLVLDSIEQETVQSERDGAALRNAVASLEQLAGGRA